MSKVYLVDAVNHIHITAREAECVQALLKSMLTRQMATCFQISPRTVEVYIASLFKKFKVHKRQELILLLKDRKDIFDWLTQKKQEEQILKKKKNKKHLGLKNNTKRQKNYLCLESQILLCRKNLFN